MENPLNNQDEHSAKMKELGKISADEKHVDPIDPVGGWIDINREQISYSGLLYPESYRFQVKPVMSSTIKYFSSLDESNPLSVNDALSYVIKHHIRVLDGKKELKCMDTIYEHDRFFFVMVVHVYSGAPTSLAYSCNCTNSDCRHKQDVEITPYNLQYSELSEKGKEYLNPELGKFIISTKSMGTRNYRPLKLSESAKLTDFVLKSQRNGEEIEPFFREAAGFICHETSALEPADSIYQKYLQLTANAKEISLLHKILEHIEVKQLLQIEVLCERCKNPFLSEIRTVAGLKNIFIDSSISDEL
jgi:hypothetical protein